MPRYTAASQLSRRGDRRALGGRCETRRRAQDIQQGSIFI